MDEAGSSGVGGGSSGPEAEYEDEPVLKYQRMGADVGKLLGPVEEEDPGEKETVVRMAVHDTCLVSRRCVWGVCQALCNLVSGNSASLPWADGSGPVVFVECNMLCSERALIYLRSVSTIGKASCMCASSSCNITRL